MSTRVQKGGTVFRPVAKARSRVAESASRQASVALDIRASHPPAAPLQDPQPNPPVPPPQAVISVAMPPPSAAPVRLHLRGTPDPAVPSNVSNVPSSVPIIVSPSRAPPQVQATELRLPPVIEEIIAPAGPSSQAGMTAVQEPTQGSRKRKAKSQSESTTSSKKPRKPRRLATPAFDADADPGEDLDPTSVTMATLCDDMGQGRVSSKAAQVQGNHLAWKKSNREKRARMRIIMEAKKYGRNEDGEPGQETRRSQVAPEQASATNAIPGSSTEPSSGAVTIAEDTSGSGFDYSQDIATSRYNVQIRIGPNGETIIDEESLFVDRNAEEDTTEYTHVEESDVTKFVNSGTYAKRFRGSRWSAEETELFYDALSQFGENYELISYVLPGRDRKACKNKFKAEDKRNSNRITYCLNNRTPYDIQTLSRMTGKDFSGPTPEIRAPTVLSLAEPTINANQVSNTASTEKAMLAGEGDDEEVLGDISSFDP
ncbi:hypothetical protein HYDPIDRAFT_109327, partial [Hydnomerulius pinastri MD-312]